MYSVQDHAKCTNVNVKVKVNSKSNWNIGVVVQNETWSQNVSKYTSWRPQKSLLLSYGNALPDSNIFLASFCMFIRKFSAYESHGLISFVYSI